MYIYWSVTVATCTGHSMRNILSPRLMRNERLNIQDFTRTRIHVLLPIQRSIFDFIYYGSQTSFIYSIWNLLFLFLFHFTRALNFYGWLFVHFSQNLHFMIKNSTLSVKCVPQHFNALSNHLISELSRGKLAC